MNFGQALAAMQNHGSVTCTELSRPGAVLVLQQPTGEITEPFIGLRLANGVCTPWSPTQDAILSTGWSVAREGQQATQAQAEHAGARG